MMIAMDSANATVITNDADELINPNAQDILDDGIDQDCGGADLSCDTTTEVNGLLIFPATRNELL